MLAAITASVIFGLVQLNPGTVFAGYVIVRLLGAGGMGEVYLAQHPRLPRHDALKVLPPDISGDEDFRQRFIREADLAASISHPNIVTVYDRGEFDGKLWIATEYVEGTDAAQLARDQYAAGMPTAEVSSIVTAIASALDYAHEQGLLHRDVKPANILCFRHGAGGGRRFALADFGIARRTNDSDGMTATNLTVGTVSYAAPEQLLGAGIDGRADQYALAVTAFHLLTGSLPFQNSNPVAVISQHLTSAPPKPGDHRHDLVVLNDVFARAMAKDPAQRYASCTEFARDLERRAAIASSVPVTAPQVEWSLPVSAAGAPTHVAGIAEGLPSPRPSRRASWAAGATVAAALIAAGIWAVPHLSGDRRESGATSTSSTRASIAAPEVEGVAAANETAKVEAVGFGRPDGSDYLWATSVVSGVRPGQFVVVSFNLLGPDGQLVATDSQTEQGINPNAKMIIGTQVTIPRGQDVARVEASVGINDYNSPAPKYEDVILEVSQLSIGEDYWGKPAAEAVIKNPSSQNIAHARVGIACFDDQGNIIGGGSTYPDLIPAGGQIKIADSVMVSQVPARCEMTAQPPS